jgi:hypothetical protein
MFLISLLATCDPGLQGENQNIEKSRLKSIHFVRLTASY